MSITDELREWMKSSTLSSWTAEHLTAIADRIDERVEREYIEAPVDADGMPWHLGDKVDGMAGSITYLSYGCIGWTFRLGDPYTFECDRYRHYHEPTVKDVLREMAIDWDYAADGEDKEAVLEEYATKFRLAKEDE